MVEACRRCRRSGVARSWFTESLGNREHGHVDQATVRIRILIAQLAGGAPVASPQVINALRGRLNVVEQGNHDARVRMLSIQRPFVHVSPVTGGPYRPRRGRRKRMDGR